MINIGSKEEDFWRDRDKSNCYWITHTHSRSNGLNKRVNQTLVNRIRCNSDKNKRNWTKITEESIEENNNTRHSVTGFAPNHLLNGKMIEIVPKEIMENKINLKRDREEAFKNSTRNFEINKQKYDKKRREHEFKIGDMVFTHNGKKWIEISWKKLGKDLS